MSLSTILSSLAGGGTGVSLGKNIGLSQIGNAQTAAVQGANAEAEAEVTAAELQKIDGDKKSKLSQLDAEQRKNRMSVNEKNASTIQF
ncbi:MAG: hypothetical protein ACRYGA_01875 [Janthinobacterium lividum]